MNWSTVIFDLDGVICTTDDYHYLAWKSIADELGIYFDREINNRLRGVSRMESLEIVLEKYSGKPLPDSEKLDLAERKNAIYRESLSRLTAADLSGEVKSTLKELRNRGFRLTIGSSSKNARFILGQLGLGDFFDAISDGNNITNSKPHPEVFLKAAEFAGEKPEHCLVVEDAVAGVQAAHAAGMMAAAIGDAAECGSGDFKLSSFGDLLRLLPRI